MYTINTRNRHVYTLLYSTRLNRGICDSYLLTWSTLSEQAFNWMISARTPAFQAWKKWSSTTPRKIVGSFSMERQDLRVFGGKSLDCGFEVCPNAQQNPLGDECEKGSFQCNNSGISHASTSNNGVLYWKGGTDTIETFFIIFCKPMQGDGVVSLNLN